MNPKIVLSIAAVMFIASLSFAQNAPKNAPADQARKTSAAAASANLSVENVNAALVNARAANKDKRYSDAETLMLRVTASKSELIYPWIELGQAQLGLKKYADAENSFQVALGVDPATLKLAHADDFYQKPGTPGD